MPGSALKLEYVDSGGRSHSIDLQGTQRVGRSPEAEIVLPEEGISRFHCELQTEAIGVTIRDLRSTNGTFVNGSKVQVARLQVGDTIVLGRTMLNVQAKDPEQETYRTTYIGSESVEVAIDASQESYRPESLDPANVQRHLQSLYGILSTISAASDMDSMFQGVLASILKTMSLEFGHVLFGPSADELVTVASVSIDGGPPAPFSTTVVGRVLAEQEAILANDIQAEPELAASDSIAAAGALRIACAPILVHDRCGALYVASKGLSKTIHPEDLSFLNAAARQIGLAAEALRERENLARENELLKKRTPRTQLIGSSPVMEAVRELMSRAARSDATILITGESGTGKELVARGIHEASVRHQHSFVALNCGALPGSVVQSELFGHEKGAFTGAETRRIGLVELASGGTLFLDEIGELPLEVQVMLLRVLEERRFFRIGGHKEVSTDVRFVAATNRDLDAMARSGEFRTDLLYRLKVVEIRTPPVREHLEDLNELTDGMLEDLARATGWAVRQPSAATRQALGRYRWPGNVRELRNVLERAMLFASGEPANALIEPHHLGLVSEGARESVPDRLCSLQELEKEHILRVLDSTGWNKSKAAEILGVARITLYEKIKNYELTPSER